MAVPVLVRERNEAYTDILAAVQSGEDPLHELETDKLGFNHANLGGHMAKRWSLPAYLTNAIANHHSESDDGPSVEPGVRLASLIEHSTDLEPQTPMYDVAKKDYGLDQGAMEQIVARTVEEAEEFAATAF
jgi:HD-like signal output (HDOD) protein